MAEIHAVSLQQVAPFLAQRGIDVLEFFGRELVAPNIFQARDTWFPRAECLRLTNAVARETGDPCAGAMIGKSARLQDFGEFGRRVTDADTVEGACRAMIGNLGLVHRGSGLTAGREGDRIFLRFALEGASTQDPTQFVQASLAVIRNILLLSGEADMVTVRLAVPYAPQWAALEAPLGERLEFGCAAEGVLFPRSLLEKPLASANAPSRDHDALRVTLRAAQIIAAMFPETPIRIDGVASRLGLTRRTLQRRLKVCGVVFSDLLDVARRDQALRSLADRSQDLLGLALDLGYGDPAHFTRAFKRWTGTTPSAFRGR
jgi:AraC-like DNA-binding protein